MNKPGGQSRQKSAPDPSEWCQIMPSTSGLSAGQSVQCCPV